MGHREETLDRLSVRVDVRASTSQNSIVWAVVDNAAHALCAVVTVYIFLVELRQQTLWSSLSDLVVAAAAGSLIDLDHFAAAFSFELEVGGLCC